VACFAVDAENVVLHAAGRTGRGRSPRLAKSGAFETKSHLSAQEFQRALNGCSLRRFDRQC